MFAHLIVIMVQPLVLHRMVLLQISQVRCLKVKTRKISGGPNMLRYKDFIPKNIDSSIHNCTALWVWGDIGPGGGTCMVSIVSVCLSICMNYTVACKHILSSKWGKE